MPIFLDVDNLPATTMVEWDRPLQKQMNDLWQSIITESSGITKIIHNDWLNLMKQAKKNFIESMLTSSYENLFKVI